MLIGDQTASDEILALVDRFAKERIIYWIEALSYIDFLMGGRESILRLRELLPVRSPNCAKFGITYFLTEWRIRSSPRAVTRHYAIHSTAL
jgi:hypothetical protein